MTEKVKRKSAAPAAKRASASVESAARAKETSAKTKKAAAKKKVATPKPAKAGAANAKPGKGVKAATTRAKPTAERVKERASKTSEAKPKAAAPAAKARKTKAKVEVSFAGYGIGDPVVDPVGDTTDGEGRTYTGEAEAHAKVEMEAFRADTNLAAMDAGLEAGRGAAQLAKEERARQAAKDEAAAATDTEAAADFAGADEAREPGKLERLQKILSKAGVASRRRAEEMIVAGRVMVNGQVVTTLGSKADATRDHIRVDGKLLHGAERHRYFLLNKPKGFVTTVSDPEGRPTVMQFFAKMHERVYPVGRLDYQSEGLLLMTNDGELANLLTKAGSGVEKTYLVKVAGQPSEAELERLRGGVAIEKSEKGSEHVQTAPARIHQVRHGDNPWYEVVLTEGRNRELRKMFAAIGHFAEKIRRVGYGPLVLDVEPGKMRELSADEVNALRLTAEGRIKPRRVNLDRVLPKEAGIATEKHFEKRSVRGGGKRFDRPVGRGNKAGFGGRRKAGHSPDRSRRVRNVVSIARNLKSRVLTGCTSNGQRTVPKVWPRGPDLKGGSHLLEGRDLSVEGGLRRDRSANLPGRNSIGRELTSRELRSADLTGHDSRSGRESGKRVACGILLSDRSLMGGSRLREGRDLLAEGGPRREPSASSGVHTVIGHGLIGPELRNRDLKSADLRSGVLTGRASRSRGSISRDLAADPADQRRAGGKMRRASRSSRRGIEQVASIDRTVRIGRAAPDGRSLGSADGRAGSEVLGVMATAVLGGQAVGAVSAGGNAGRTMIAKSEARWGDSDGECVWQRYSDSGAGSEGSSRFLCEAPWLHNHWRARPVD